MASKVTFSSEAQADITEIVTHIAGDNPEAALRFHDELLDRCNALSANPERGVSVASGIRRLVFGNYLIFYRVQPDRVQIARIVPGARLISPDLAD